MKIYREQLRPVLQAYTTYYNEIFSDSVPSDDWRKECACSYNSRVMNTIKKDDLLTTEEVSLLLKEFDKLPARKDASTISMLDGPLSHPKWQTLLELVDEYPEKAALVFTHLFQNKRSLEGRLRFFMDEFDKDTFNSVGAQIEDGTRSVTPSPLFGIPTTLLMFAYPDRYVSYQFGRFRKFFESYTDYTVHNASSADLVAQYLDLDIGVHKIKEELDPILDSCNMIDVRNVIRHYKDLEEYTRSHRNTSDESFSVDSNTESSSSNPDSLNPNSLTEYYEAFRSVRDTLEKFLIFDGSNIDPENLRHPAVQYYILLDAIVTISNLSSKLFFGYGPQQAKRNTISVNEYRQEYGNGDWIQDYQQISVEPFRKDSQKLLKKKNLVDNLKSCVRPVAPESEIPIPEIVESSAEFQDAIKLLKEFPAYPATPTDESSDDSLPVTQIYSEITSDLPDDVKINLQSVDEASLDESASSPVTNQGSQIVSKDEARSLLEKCVGPDAEFRPQQWEAINQLVNNKEKLLLVQRTGWGKSTVYFIATKLLRQRGLGPTLIISPLLSLMRNQIEDAENELGLTAVTINSNNQNEWEDAKAAVLEGDCDILLISPERLAKQEFRNTVLADMDSGFGMLVVDEAHCISDWGHDFRPDYRRVKRILERLPDGTPVAATTATANDRVVEDVTTQLPGLRPMRGDLVRDSLKLQAIELTSRERRLAWITENFPDSAHSGIIYCLTTEDVETVAAWLDNHGYDTLPYHGRLDGDVRREREESLIENEVDALVATKALGMGFNKPDLGFVIHFQRPPNLIQYYQEIGRAGRELGEAQAVLLSGEDDDDIAEYFIESAFPEPEHFEKVLHVIADSEDPLYKRDVAKQVNISYTHIATCLDILQVEQAIVREENGYVRTPNPWKYDYERVQRVTEQRWNELEEIKKYVQTDKCLTQFIDNRLDGSLNTNCGHCANCAGPFVPTTVKDERLVEAAQQFHQGRNWRSIKPRKRVPERSGSSSTIPKEERLESGRALSVWDDPGLGELVRIGKYEDGEFSDRLVQAAAKFITEEWDMNPEPKWVTTVPCKSDPGLISDFGERLARVLSLNFEEKIKKVHQTQPQKQMENSYHKCWNIKGAYTVTGEVRSEPVLLVDDIVGSRWTLTEVGRGLRKAGVEAVYPFALAKRRGG